jgi:hypothetical protein
VLLLLGCEQQAATSSGSAASPPPHGGFLITLPGGKGYAEIVNKVAAQTAGRRPNSTITVYFLQTDMKSPITPAPTNVSMTVDSGGTPQTVPLTASAEGEFSSKPGQYGGGGDLNGKLTATIGSDSVTAPVAIR